MPWSRATGSTATIRWCTAEQVEAAGVAPWTELPIWLPGDGELSAMHRGDVSAAIAAGLHCRPITDTVADTWAWLNGPEPPASSAPARAAPAWTPPPKPASSPPSTADRRSNAVRPECWDPRRGRRHSGDPSRTRVTRGSLTHGTPRRNRVDPFGDLHAVADRGMFMGNRGCLVDDHERVVRHHRGDLWIICAAEFRGRRVPLAAPRPLHADLLPRRRRRPGRRSSPVRRVPSHRLRRLPARRHRCARP